MAGKDIPKIGVQCPFCDEIVRFRVVFGEGGQFRAEHDPDVCREYTQNMGDQFLEDLLDKARRL